MKKLLFVFTLWFPATQLISQDLAPQFSVSARTTGYDLSVSQYAGNSTIGYYALGVFESVGVIARLDSGMSVVNKHPIDKKIYSTRQSPLCSLKAMGEHLWFFRQVYNGKQKRYDLEAREVNRDSLTLSSPRVVTSPENITTTISLSLALDKTFSPDSKLMLYYSPVVSDKNDQVIYLKVLDSGMHMLWEKEIHTQMAPSEMTITKVRIDNSGRIYMLIHRKTYFKRTEKQEYHFLACRDNGTFFKDVAVDIPDHFITDCSFDISTDGAAHVLGTYNVSGDDFIDGTFMITLEKWGYVTGSPILTPFSADLVSEFGYTDEDSVRKIQARFPVCDVHATPDGGATLLLEHNYEMNQFETSGDLSSTVTIQSVTTQYRMEILAFHYNSNILFWQDIIYKKQSTALGHDQHMSFKVFYHDNDTWLFYNDNVVDDQNSYEYSSGQLNVCKLDSDGTIHLGDLSPALPRETIFLKQYAAQAGEDELLLYCSSNFYLRRVRFIMN